MSGAAEIWSLRSISQLSSAAGAETSCISHSRPAVNCKDYYLKLKPCIAHLVTQLWWCAGKKWFGIPLLESFSESVEDEVKWVTAWLILVLWVSLNILTRLEGHLSSENCSWVAPKILSWQNIPPRSNHWNEGQLNQNQTQTQWWCVWCVIVLCCKIYQDCSVLFF